MRVESATIGGRMDKQAERYGAVIERGRISAVEATGYVVESESRPGIVTPPIPDIAGTTRAVGDRVVFFMFDDGDGRILCGIG